MANVSENIKCENNFKTLKEESAIEQLKINSDSNIVKTIEGLSKEYKNGLKSTLEKLDMVNNQSDKNLKVLQNANSICKELIKSLVDLSELIEPSGKQTKELTEGKTIGSATKTILVSSLAEDLAESASSLIGEYAGSAFGSSVGNLIENGLTKGFQGALVGMALFMANPILGLVVGGGMGLLSALIDGATASFKNKNEAFKGLVKERISAIQEKQGQYMQESSAIALVKIAGDAQINQDTDIENSNAVKFYKSQESVNQKEQELKMITGEEYYSQQASSMQNKEAYYNSNSGEGKIEARKAKMYGLIEGTLKNKETQLGVDIDNAIASGDFSSLEIPDSNKNKLEDIYAQLSGLDYENNFYDAVKAKSLFDEVDVIKANSFELSDEYTSTYNAGTNFIGAVRSTIDNNDTKELYERKMNRNEEYTKGIRVGKEEQQFNPHENIREGADMDEKSAEINLEFAQKILENFKSGQIAQGAIAAAIAINGLNGAWNDAVSQIDYPIPLYKQTDPVNKTQTVNVEVNVSDMIIREEADIKKVAEAVAEQFTWQVTKTVLVSV